MNNWRKGREGERRAEEYLRRRGYEVIARNFRSRRGEIDIVAAKGERVVFVEVKNWNSLGAEDLEYAIDQRKQQRIREASRYFIYKNPEFQGRELSYDVLLFSSREPEIKHYENAFDGGMS